MSRSHKPRKMSWHKRWPGKPCIRADLATRGGSMISVVKVLTDAEMEAVLRALFPNMKRVPE